MRYQVRGMELVDIPQVAGIERESFPSPWPATNFRRELSNGSAQYLVVCEPGEDGPQNEERQDPVPESILGKLQSRVRRLFAEGAPDPRGQEVVGYAGLWLMVDEAHITTIAVREDRRGQGLGELLLGALADRALELRAAFLTLEVRASNLLAQRLYRKYGFHEVGLRRGYYTDNREDAVLMSTDAITSASFQRNLQQLKSALAEGWASEGGPEA